MNKTFVYGIVYKKTFHSDNAQIDIDIEDGVYQLDVAADEYLETIQPADMNEFEKYIKKRPKMQILTGYSFNKCEIIPQNHIQFKNEKQFPLVITNDEITLDDWNICRCLYIPYKNILFFIDYKYDGLYERLQNVKEYFDNNKSLSELKDITPEMRLIFALHQLQKLKIEEELKKLKELEFLKTVPGRVKKIVEDSGGKFIGIREYQKGYVVDWSMGSYQINTLMNKKFSIIEAGFCLSGNDKKHTFTSITKLLGDYIQNNDYFSVTRR